MPDRADAGVSDGVACAVDRSHASRDRAKHQHRAARSSRLRAAPLPGAGLRLDAGLLGVGPGCRGLLLGARRLGAAAAGRVLWTPGYWGWNDGVYVFNDRYWGPTVGFYGGIAYGFGYTGSGFFGGHWQGGQYYYNSSVTNVTNVTNVYQCLQSARPGHASARRQLQWRPRRHDRQAYACGTRRPRRKSIFVRPPSSSATSDAAKANPEPHFSHNKGKPPLLADKKPLALTGKPAEAKPKKEKAEPGKVSRRTEAGGSETKKDHGEPKKEHAEPKKVHDEPKKEHAEPRKDHEEPKKEHTEPKKVHEEPKKEHAEPKKAHEEPKKEHAAPPPHPAPHRAAPPPRHAAPPPQHAKPCKPHC